jgi:hypothetical protein
MLPTSKSRARVSRLPSPRMNGICVAHTLSVFLLHVSKLVLFDAFPRLKNTFVTSPVYAVVVGDPSEHG